MAKEEKKLEVAIPEGVEVSLDKGVFTIRGEKGEVQRDLFHPRLKYSIKDDNIVFEAKKPTNRERKLMHTYRTHLQNLFRGVTEGITYKLQVCSSHFPMTVDYNNGELTVKNFIGERTPRTMKVSEDVNVKIDGDEIILEGLDKEEVGQTAASIEKLTRRKGFDHRIFQDGIYIIEKDGKELA